MCNFPVAENSTPNMVRAGIVGIAWQYLGLIIRSLSSLIIGVILARILGPEPFGQVAVALLVIGLANLLADFGIGSALIQQKDVSNEDIRLVFTIQVIVGVAMSIVVALSAGIIASLLRMPETAPVIRAISPVFGVQALGQTSANLLRRALAFRALQTAAVSSYIVSYAGIGILLAFAGWGVWSLVIAQLCSTVLNAVLLYSRVRHQIAPTLQGRMNIFIGFGFQATITNLASWAIGNLDTVVIGRSFGVVPLGLYNRAFFVTYTPMYSLVSAFQSVLFSSYSQVQDNREGLRCAYLSSVTVVALMSGSVMVSVAVVSETVITGLYGESWSGATPILQALALAMPSYALMALAAPLLWGVGRIDQDVKVQVLSAFIMLVTLVLTSSLSLAILSWGVSAVYLLRCFLLTRLTARHLDIIRADLIRAIKGAVLVSLGTAVTVWTLDQITSSMELSPTMRLLVDSLGGFCAMSFFTLLFRRTLWTPEVSWLWERWGIRVHGPLSRLVPASRD